MLINWMMEHDRSQRRKNGENVHDNYKRYQILKMMEPEIDEKFKNGLISEEKYVSYKGSLKKAEKNMGVR